MIMAMTQPTPRKRAEILQCPWCDQDVGVTLDLVAREMPCPHCSQAIIIPSVDGSTDLPVQDDSFVLDYAAPDDDPSRDERLREESESRLSSLRIQKITAERRALNRSRSVATAVALALTIVCLNCLWLIVRNATIDGPGASVSTSLAVIALLCGYIAVRLFRRSRRLAALARQPLLEEPAVEPDFTPLSDGSQQWRNLEKLK